MATVPVGIEDLRIMRAVLGRVSALLAKQELEVPGEYVVPDEVRAAAEAAIPDFMVVEDNDRSYAADSVLRAIMPLLPLAQNVSNAELLGLVLPGSTDT